MKLNFLALILLVSSPQVWSNACDLGNYDELVNGIKKNRASGVELTTAQAKGKIAEYNQAAEGIIEQLYSKQGDAASLTSHYFMLHSETAALYRKLAAEDPPALLLAAKHYLLADDFPTAVSFYKRAIKKGAATSGEVNSQLSKIMRELEEEYSNPIIRRQLTAIEEARNMLNPAGISSTPVATVARPAVVTPPSTPSLQVGNSPRPAAAAAPASPGANSGATVSPARPTVTNTAPKPSAPAAPPTPLAPTINPALAQNMNDFLPKLSAVEAKQMALKLQKEGNLDEASRHLLAANSGKLVTNVHDRQFSDAIQMSLRGEGKTALQVVEVLKPGELNDFCLSIHELPGLLMSTPGSQQRKNYGQLLERLNKPDLFGKLNFAQQDVMRRALRDFRP